MTARILLGIDFTKSLQVDGGILYQAFSICCHSFSLVRELTHSLITAPQYACKILLIDCNTPLYDCKHLQLACNIPLPICNIPLSDWTILLYDSKPCIDIVGLRLSYVAEANQEIEQLAESLGLQINEAKTKLIVATSAGLPINNQNLCMWYTDRWTHVWSRPIIHLSWVKGPQRQQHGSWVARKDANRSFYSLKNQFTSKNQSRRTKLGLYSAYIVPVLTYASETWTLSKSDETLLAAFERKMLRRILGPVCVEGQ